MKHPASRDRWIVIAEFRLAAGRFLSSLTRHGVSPLVSPRNPPGRPRSDLYRIVIPMFTRFLIRGVLMLLCTLPTMAAERELSTLVKASLVFREDFDATRQPYTHILKVFLRLDNTHDSDVSWVANRVSGIEAELLDAAGNLVPPTGPATMSVRSNYEAFYLPYGSGLDWLISHGGVNFVANARGKYALLVGSRGWLIPIGAASSYSLRIRLRGLPLTRTFERADLQNSKLLFDLPPARLEITK